MSAREEWRVNEREDLDDTHNERRREPEHSDASSAYLTILLL